MKKIISLGVMTVLFMTNMAFAEEQDIQPIQEQQAPSASSMQDSMQGKPMPLQPSQPGLQQQQPAAPAAKQTTPATQTTVDAAQKAQIEKIVHDYLINNPEVLIEASKVLQDRQRDEMVKKAEEAIKSNLDGLFNAEQSPVVGSNAANVSIVEFFDYQCSHCKDMAPVVASLIKQDPNLKVIYKEFPIFGGSSDFAAKAALAANKQGKFAEFHEALMGATEKLDENAIMNAAKKVGLNTKRLKNDMLSKEVETELQQNMQLAESIGIMGTPAFIVSINPPGDSTKMFYVPGASSKERLEALISKIRGN